MIPREIQQLEDNLSKLTLLSDFERGLVRKALEVAAEEFSKMTFYGEWSQEIAARMLEIRSRIERDPKTRW